MKKSTEMNIFYSCSILLLSFLLFLSAGCRSMPDFSGAEGEQKNIDWTASRITEELAGSDPIEPFNRTMFAITDFCMHYIVRPIGYVYGSILPMEVIKRIDYASDNLAFPCRMFSCFLQGEFKGGGVEFLRFLTNSTIGIAGFFDPAEAWFGLERRNEDFGQTFGYWNIGPGCYFVLPFFASSNVRDTVGVVFDRATDMKSYIPYFGYLAGINSAVNSYDSYSSLTENSCDVYENTKVVMSLMRYAQVENFHKKLLHTEQSNFGKAEIPQIPFQGNMIKCASQYGAQNPLIDTLKGAFFQVRKNNSGWWIKTSLWNTDFIPLAETSSISFTDKKEDARQMEYQIFLQEEKKDAPLVLLIPGAGGHYKAGMLRALAEIYFEKGCSVVVLANSLNPAFFLPAGDGLPGDVKKDTANVRKALKKIIHQVKKEHGLLPSRLIVGGYSLGGLHTLHLAALEEKENNPMKIDRFIAINPPADLIYALQKMDSFCDIPKDLSKKEFFDMAGDAAMKIYRASSGKKGVLGVLRPQSRKEGIKDAGKKEVKKKAEEKENRKENHKEKVWDNPLYLPLSPRQAGWISGIYMRMGLRELLFAAQREFPFGERPLRTPYSWWQRSTLYREIDSYNWMEYAQKILLPSLQKKEKDLTMEKLGMRAALQSISSTLEKNPRVRVLHNLDDPLLQKKDILFLDETLKSKITWFDCGGHLGNMFLGVYKKAILESTFGVEKCDTKKMEK